MGQWRLLLFLLLRLLLLGAAYFLAGSFWLSTVTGMVISADWMAGLGRGASTVSIPSGDSEDRTAVASTPGGRLGGERRAGKGYSTNPGDAMLSPKSLPLPPPAGLSSIPGLASGLWRAWVGGKMSPKTSGGCARCLSSSLVLTCIFG